MELELIPPPRSSSANSHASTSSSNWTDSDSDSDEESNRITTQIDQRPLPPRTVSQLTSKSCWICYGEENEESAGNQSRWIHACKCTLVAHEECLLKWIQSYERNHTNEPCCPACRELYLIREEKSMNLVFLLVLEKVWRKISVLCVTAGTTASIIAAASAYGKWTIVQFAGEASVELKQNWLQRINGLSSATIPVILLLSRTSKLNSIFPFFPLLFLSDLVQLPTLTLEYPPSLSLTVALLPWLRLLYLKSKEEFYKRIGLEQPRWHEVFELDRLPAQDDLGQEDEVLLRPAEILSLGRIASTITSTLLFPLGARLVGSLLFHLGTRFKVSQVSAFLQPIHLRSVVGGTMIILIRDSVELYRGVLRRRKISSRKVVSKSFGTLDL